MDSLILIPVPIEPNTMLLSIEATQIRQKKSIKFALLGSMGSHSLIKRSLAHQKATPKVHARGCLHFTRKRSKLRSFTLNNTIFIKYLLRIGIYNLFPTFSGSFKLQAEEMDHLIIGSKCQHVFEDH